MRMCRDVELKEVDYEVSDNEEEREERGEEHPLEADI